MTRQQTQSRSPNSTVSFCRALQRLRTFCESRPLLSVFLLAFSLRAIVIAVLATAGITDTFSFDATTYDGMARAVVEGRAESWDEGTSGLYAATFTFMAPVSLIYFITGSNQAIAQLYVAVLGAGVAVAVTALALKCTQPRWALAAGTFVAVLPSQVLWSSLLLKDASIWLILAGIAIAAAMAATRTNLRMVAWWSLAALLLFALGYLRGHTTVVAAWSLAIAAFLGIREQRFIRGFAGVVVAVTIPWMVGLGPAGLDLATNAGDLGYRRAANALGANSAFVEALGSERADTGNEEFQASVIELENALRTEKDPEKRKTLEKEVAAAKERLLTAAKERLLAPGGASLEDSGSLAPHIRHLPRGLSVMLLEPVPWRTGGSNLMQMARLEALVWYPLLGLAVVGLWSARKHIRTLGFPIICGAGVLLLYALAEGNIGTAFRHRGEFVWVVCLMAGMGAAQVVSWRAKHHLDSDEQTQGSTFL